MRRIAMVSYNKFIQGESNGWKKNNDNHVLLLQGKLRWGWDDTYATKVDNLWDQLVEVLPTLDRVIIYVGSYGAERIIRIPAKLGITPERMTFVLCNCKKDQKLTEIDLRGFHFSEVIICECGGLITMKDLYTKVLTAKSDLVF